MRLAITGAPRTGKSTLARDLQRTANARCESMPIFCTDPIHLVKEPLPGVTYVPRDVYHLARAVGMSGEDPGPDQPWSSSSWYVAEHFLTAPGSWILEGVGVPRALRKWRKTAPHADGLWRSSLEAVGFPQGCPIDRLIVMQKAKTAQLPGQVAQGKGAMTVLRELLPWLGTRVEWR